MVELDNSGVNLKLKALLEGPYDQGLNTMNDGLRQNGFLPVAEPFTTLGFNHFGDGGGETMAASVLNVSGNDAIVDWIMIEIRSNANPTNILATKSALVQRDGDIVDVNGSSILNFQSITDDEVIVALRHRNHFGIRTANAYSTALTIDIDFRQNSTSLFGIDPTNFVGGNRVMISGDANRDGQINTVDKNNYWRIQNGTPYSYLNTSGLNNSKVEQLD